MSKQENNNPLTPEATAKEVPQRSFNYTELSELVAKAVASAQLQVAETLAASGNRQAEVLADALRESRKPYVDPKQVENEKTMRDQMRETERNRRRNKRAEQSSCPHQMGCSPESATSLPDSAFAIHVLDTKEVIGICTNCQKIVSSRRPEDLIWFQKKGRNVRSAAGDRFFVDTQKAIQSRGMTDAEIAPKDKE